MKDERHGFFYRAIRAYYYQGVAASWLDKPLRFRQEAVQIATLLGVGGVAIFTPRFLVFAIIAYIFVTLFFIGLGYVVVKLGWVKYDTTVNNEQNPQIVEIMSDIKEIKELLKNYNEPW